MNRDIGLAIHLGRVVLRRRSWYCRVAQDDFIGHAARHFNPQRKRGDVEQQHVLRDFGAATKNIRLYGRAQRNYFVGI